MMRCAWCGSTKPGKRGFVEVPRASYQCPRLPDMVAYHRFRHDCVLHPLEALFAAAGFSPERGMNWLQENTNLISDNCVDFFDVAPCDLWEVLEAASFKFNPLWLAALRESFERKNTEEA